VDAFQKAVLFSHGSPRMMGALGQGTHSAQSTCRPLQCFRNWIRCPGIDVSPFESSLIPIGLGNWTLRSSGCKSMRCAGIRTRRYSHRSALRLAPDRDSDFTSCSRASHAPSHLPVTRSDGLLGQYRICEPLQFLTAWQLQFVGRDCCLDDIGDVGLVIEQMRANLSELEFALSLGVQRHILPSDGIQLVLPRTPEQRAF
jgi:hypothetical protein